MTFWTPEIIDKAKRMWRERLGSQRIADNLGTSRNSVVGKAHRDGWEGGNPPSRQPKPKTRVIPPLRPFSRSVNPKNANPSGYRGIKPRMATPPRPRPAPVPIENLVVPVSLKVSLMQLTDQMCKWPIGDPTDPAFSFCGHRNFNSLPYCEYHSRIAFQPVHR